jgi:DNA-binding IclR family transcriptional regulator
MKTATTVTKVCRILDQFKNRPSLGITDLARSLEMLPSDVHRIVSSLQLYGYVQQNTETKRYHLGAGLLRLSLTTLQRNVFQEKGRAVLIRLSARLDAATHLGLLDTGRCEVFLAYQVDNAVLDIFKSHLGSTAAMHSTALGKTIMADMMAKRFSALLNVAACRRVRGKPLPNCRRWKRSSISSAIAATLPTTKNPPKGHAASAVRFATAQAWLSEQLAHR